MHTGLSRRQIPTILEYHERLLEELRHRIESRDANMCVGDVICRLVSQHLRRRRHLSAVESTSASGTSCLLVSQRLYRRRHLMAGELTCASRTSQEFKVSLVTVINVAGIFLYICEIVFRAFDCSVIVQSLQIITINKYLYCTIDADFQFHCDS